MNQCYKDKNFTQNLMFKQAQNIIKIHCVVYEIKHADFFQLIPFGHRERVNQNSNIPCDGEISNLRTPSRFPNILIFRIHSG